MQFAMNNAWFLNTLFALGAITASFNVHAALDMSDATSQNISAYVAVLSDAEQKRVNAYHDMIENHLNQNFSIVRTVRILTSHYPQDVNEILLAAYKHRPKQLSVISRAVIRSEAALTSDVLDTALSIAPENYTDIIRMAIKAEPAYIDDIVAVAAQHQPNHLEEIVRVAITTEPDLSGSVIYSAATNSDSGFLDTIANVFASIPESTTNLLYAVKDFFTGQETAEQPTQLQAKPEQWQRFLTIAKAQGVTKQEMLWLQKQGYVTEEQLAKVYSTSANE